MVRTAPAACAAWHARSAAKCNVRSDSRLQRTAWGCARTVAQIATVAAVARVLLARAAESRTAGRAAVRSGSGGYRHGGTDGAGGGVTAGIDIGSLDLTIHLGYAGSASSYLQQAGRAGRAGQPSLSLFVPMDCALDQYLALHADTLFAPAANAVCIDAVRSLCIRACSCVHSGSVMHGHMDACMRACGVCVRRTQHSFAGTSRLRCSSCAKCGPAARTCPLSRSCGPSRPCAPSPTTSCARINCACPRPVRPTADCGTGPLGGPQQHERSTASCA